MVSIHLLSLLNLDLLYGLMLVSQAVASCLNFCGTFSEGIPTIIPIYLEVGNCCAS